MVQRMVVVSGTPLWAKILAVVAILVLIKIAIVIAIMIGAAVVFYRFAPMVCKLLIFLGLAYILVTQFPLIGGGLAFAAAVLFMLWLVGRSSAKNDADLV